MLNKTYVGKTSDIQLQLIDALESVYGQDDQKHLCRASVDEHGNEQVRLKVYDETHDEYSEFLMTCHKGTVDKELEISSDCVTLFDERTAPNEEFEYFFDDNRNRWIVGESYISHMLNEIERETNYLWRRREEGFTQIPIDVVQGFRLASTFEPYHLRHSVYDDILECTQTYISPDMDDPTEHIVRIDKDDKNEEFRVYAATTRELDGNHWQLCGECELTNLEALGSAIDKATAVSTKALDPLYGLAIADEYQL